MRTIAYLVFTAALCLHFSLRERRQAVQCGRKQGYRLCCVHAAAHDSQYVNLSRYSTVRPSDLFISFATQRSVSIAEGTPMSSRRLPPSSFSSASRYSWPGLWRRGSVTIHRLPRRQKQNGELHRKRSRFIVRKWRGDSCIQLCRATSCLPLVPMMFLVWPAPLTRPRPLYQVMVHKSQEVLARDVLSEYPWFAHSPRDGGLRIKAVKEVSSSLVDPECPSQF
jgi:hypothetical protein